jgi:hypothetical protein
VTGPIAFPTIQPAQVAPPRRDQLADLPQLIMALAQHREAVANAAAQLDLERQRTEASVAASGAATANSKQELKDKQLAFDTKQKQLQAHDIVANELPGVLTQPGDFTQNAEAARVKLIQTNKQLAPFINDAFNSQIADVSRTRTAIAERRTAEANAPVAELTAASRIATAKSEAKRSASDAQRAATEAETATIQKHLAQLDEQYGPGRSAMATATLAGGGTLGQAYRISGVPVPAGVDPNWTTAKGANGALAARQADYVKLMEGAVPGLEQLYKKADAKAVTALIKFPMALNGMANPATQQYVMHARDFLAGVLHEESGARLNDAQLAWGVPRYIVIGGDSPSTKAAKMANVRAVLEQRRKNPNYQIPGAPLSDAGQQTFFGDSTRAGAAVPPAGVHPVVSDRFQTKPPAPPTR